MNMHHEQNAGERMVKTETQVAALQAHVAECLAGFRPGIEARLRAIEVKFAYYTGGLAALQIGIAYILAIYLKKSP